MVTHRCSPEQVIKLEPSPHNLERTSVHGQESAGSPAARPSNTLATAVNTSGDEARASATELARNSRSCRVTGGTRWPSLPMASSSLRPPRPVCPTPLFMPGTGRPARSCILAGRPILMVLSATFFALAPNVRNWTADPSLVALDWPGKLSGTPWLRAKGGDAMDFFRPRFTGIVIVARVTLLRGRLHEDERTREPKP